MSREVRAKLLFHRRSEGGTQIILRLALLVKMNLHTPIELSALFGHVGRNGPAVSKSHVGHALGGNTF